MYSEFFATTAQYCPTLKADVIPDHDSFVCGRQFGEPNHWMTALKDNGSYVFISARILQPFDFASRTGTIAFDVDAKTAGSHSWWPEVWITDQPQPAPHEGASANAALQPRNGIGFELGGGGCAARGIAGKTPNDASAGMAAVDRVAVIHNYRETLLDFRGAADPCYRVQADHQNHFEVRISRNRVELWASDFTHDLGATFPRFRRILVADNLRLPFSRGYVQFQQTHYNAEKSGVSDMQTYHWHGIGFDGPALTAERDYQVPDSLQKHFVWPSKTKFDGYNLGYPLDGRTFRLPDVDISSARAAWLTLTFWNEGDRPQVQLRYRLNGRAWRTYTDPHRINGSSNVGLLIPVPLTELRNGTNTLQIRQGNARGEIANVDLLVDP